MSSAEFPSFIAAMMPPPSPHDEWRKQDGLTLHVVGNGGLVLLADGTRVPIATLATHRPGELRSRTRFGPLPPYAAIPTGNSTLSIV